MPVSPTEKLLFSLASFLKKTKMTGMTGRISPFVNIKPFKRVATVKLNCKLTRMHIVKTKYMIFAIFKCFMHNAEKWPNMLYKFCVALTAKFLKYVRPFFNVMHGKVKKATGNCKLSGHNILKVLSNFWLLLFKITEVTKKIKIGKFFDKPGLREPELRTFSENQCVLWKV